MEANGLQLPFYRYDYSGEMKVGISGVHDGDRLARLSFYMTGQTNLSGFRFLATIDDIYYGCYRSYQEDEWIPSGFATIQVAGLSNTETRDLYLRPLKVTYDESGKYSSAFRGPKSNTVQISPEPKHPETSGVVRDLQLEKGDLIYTSAKTFNDSNFDYSSQYSYGGNSYDPISFTPNVAVGIFYATAKIDARFVDGTKDTTQKWFVDFNVNSVSIKNIKEPFKFLLEGDGTRGIAEAFDSQRTFLGKNNPNMTVEQEKIIEYRLRYEYVKAKKSIKQKLSTLLSQNPSLLLKNISTYRRLLDLLVGDDLDLQLYPNKFKIPYIGIIYLHPKIISAHHQDATPFNYSLKNIRGKNLKQGQSNLAILTNYPQDFSYFSMLPLYNVISEDQVFGNNNLTDAN